MGWSSVESATSTYTYRSYQPEKARPLDSAGLHRDATIDHHLNEVLANQYVEELRWLIDERTTALTEIKNRCACLTRTQVGGSCNKHSGQT